MTIEQAINQIAELYEPTYSPAILTRWLWEMDQRMLQEELLRTDIIDEYNPDTDMDVTLLIPAPYERLYILYLARMIHLHRGEYDQAANFESEWNQLKNEYMAHLLNDLPRTPGGRPWMDETLTLRAGRKFVGCLYWIRRNIVAIDVDLIRDGTVIDHWSHGTGDKLAVVDGVLTLTLEAYYTSEMKPGGYQIRVTVKNDDANKLDAYPIPLRVLAAYPLYSS